jgi:hypothetical protein
MNTSQGKPAGAEAQITHDYVGPVPGTSVIYVLVAEREKFDRIDRPVIDHSTRKDGQRVLTKTVGELVGNQGVVIFQHWLDGAAPEEQFSGPGVSAHVQGAVQWNG